MDIDGIWREVITYGENYGGDQGRTLSFNVEIEQYGNSFDAVAVDISGFGMNTEPADIHGEIFGGDISFTKQYRAISIAGGPIDPPQPGIEILYTGKYSISQGQFNGTWKFKPGIYKWEDNYFESQGEGTWVMQRI